MRIEESGGIRIQYLDVDGPAIVTSADTSDLIGNAWVENVDMIAVPVPRLEPEFFDLSSLKAGEILQKVVNHRLKLAIIGDLSRYLEASLALRDFVWESNRGEHIWFLDDEEDLTARLTSKR